MGPEMFLKTSMRKVYDTEENTLSISQLVLIASVSRYGYERFKQLLFDKAFRLVYLVIVFVVDCRNMPF